ncbi:endothelin-converting enzyme 1-like [Rhipicephalus microplus]|uniref:endothelin-converting enzyme 1-like n=1 Tax=Rhipicephalus microplus TaxID=6941 RepID=UPI003F6AF3DF
MSSTWRKATEDNESSNTETNKPTAAVDASSASLFAAQKPEAASTHSDSEKAVAARVSNAEVQPQNHRRTSVVNPQPCPPSVMPSPPVAASASDARTSQTMVQDVPAKVADTAVKQDASTRTALSKRTPATNLPSKAGHLGDAPSTGSDSPAITGSTISPGKPGSMVSGPSQVADMYKTLETLTAFGEKERTRQDSTRASNTTFNIRMELSSITDRYFSSPARRRLKRLLAVSLLAITLLTIVAASVFLLYPKPKRRLRSYCETKGCEAHRYQISHQLDKSIDPCDDFSAYVCARWKPRKEFQLSRSQLSDMFLSWLYKLPETLAKGVVHFPVGKKVAAIFDSCMTETGSHVPVMREFMRDRDILWPDDPEEPVTPAKPLFDLSFNWNVHLWFTLRIIPATSEEKSRRVFFAPNYLMALWKALINEIPKTYFESVYAQLFEIFSSNKSSEPDTKDASRTHDVLTYIFNKLLPSCPCEPRIQASLNLTEFENMTSYFFGRHTINLLNAVTRINPPVTMNETVLISDIFQFLRMKNIIDEVDDKTLLRHLSWLFLQGYAAVAYPTAVLLVLHGSEHRAEEERPRFCARQIEPGYKLLIAAMATVAHFSENERRNIDHLLGNILQVAVDKTWACSWFDNDTKQAAAGKLTNMSTVVWPPEKFLDPEVLEEVYKDFPDNASSFAEYWIETRRRQRLLFGSEASTAEQLLGDNTHPPYAAYVQLLNHLSLSLGALAPPLYYPDGTNAMLYGGVLYLYARALITAVGNEGFTVNAEAEVTSSWLSREVQKAFSLRALHCLPGGVSIFPEVPAMEVAYEAFKRRIDKNNTLPLSEDLTEEKVFFITACLSTCARTPSDNLFGGDCNKAVMNFAPFAEAFNCPAGSKMNPKNKCSYYD